MIITTTTEARNAAQEIVGAVHVYLARNGIPVGVPKAEDDGTITQILARFERDIRASLTQAERPLPGREADRLTGYPDYIDDPEGLERIRAGLLRVADWHDQLPDGLLNCNSLGRLLDTIERLRPALLSAPYTPVGVDGEAIRQSIIRQLGGDPNADRVILPGTDWDIVLTALAKPFPEPDQGMVLVPREPTDEMLDQGVAALESAPFVPPSRVWSAMLAALPQGNPHVQ